MKYSQIFTKTKKEAPSDEHSKNAQLLIRAGYVYKVMAGVYAYTPLGLRVLDKIKQIVRDEMNAIGGQELIMTNLQPKSTWLSTKRWDDSIVDIWFKTSLQDGTELGLAWSHEESIMEMMQSYITSYKDLPVSVYQFQTKLRNELRAKSGIMRGREFVMKDMYSLHRTEEDLKQYYDGVTEAYKVIFDKLGIGKDTYVTFASGGAFTKFSHEFQTICEAGEDILYLDKEKNIAVNEEVLEDAIKDLGINRDNLEKVKSAEVGNIFNFGTEKSEQMGINFTDEDGKAKPMFLASYGIGITRVMGVIAEKFADEKGLIWPENVSPYLLYLTFVGNDDDVISNTENIYEELISIGYEVLFDDRDVRPGEKFADADLLGIPHRVVVSRKTHDQNLIEYKSRSATELELISVEELKNKLN